MSLSVQAPYNPLKISGVIQATPGSNGFIGLAQPAKAAPAKAAAPPPSYSGGGGGGGGGYAAPPAPVYAPALNIAALTSQARASAEGAVNPYYTKSLNDFLAQQSALKAQQQQSYDLDIKNFQDQLNQTLDQNATTKTRTAEDTATNEAQVADTADQFQTDSGKQFTTDRLAKAETVAQAGLTGGIGAQQQEAAQEAHNTDESRQTTQFQQQKDQQELFKSRTFEDLAKSGELATTTSNKGQAQAKFNLDNYITNQNFDIQNKKNDLEQSRLQAVAAEQKNQAHLAFNKFIAGIANPAQRQAAINAYSSLI